jgi:uncharacterized protein YjbI with pentapeptide repeats/DNA-binding XRE family transcriptional regulator
MLQSTTIGNKIANARKKLNLSQATLAQQVSISPQAVGKWERGESMPDITTLNRLAIILRVDLNYFSDSFTHEPLILTDNVKDDKLAFENINSIQKKRFDWQWDMSRGNWLDADFSGLKDLKEPFSASNIKNCQFIKSDLSGIHLKGNDIANCDFSNADMRNCKIQSSEITKSQFNESILIDTLVSESEIKHCNFSHANFSGAEFKNSEFQHNLIQFAIWKHTSFKNMGLSNIVFEGNIENCSFENCSFKNVKFENANILNTFFKQNRRLNRVEFIHCKADKLTYAFLKNNGANTAGITIIESSSGLAHEIQNNGIPSI